VRVAVRMRMMSKVMAKKRRLTGEIHGIRERGTS